MSEKRTRATLVSLSPIVKEDKILLMNSLTKLQLLQSMGIPFLGLLVGSLSQILPESSMTNTRSSTVFGHPAEIKVPWSEKHTIFQGSGAIDLLVFYTSLVILFYFNCRQRCYK